MFSHVFFNRFKILLKNRMMIFWTLIFPMILGTFFNLAFSNLSSEENFKAINIAILDNEKFQDDENFKKFINNLSQNNDNKIFNIEYTDSVEDAESMIDQNETIGYIEIIDNKAKLHFKKNGFEQTITKSIIDDYYQSVSMINNIANFNYELIKDNIINKIDFNSNYFKNDDSNNLDITVIYFYTLIGMVCIYGGLFGIDAINESEANLTKRGARINVAPTHKLKVLLASLLVALIVHFSEVLLTIAYLVFVLGIDFGNKIGYILVLALFGSLAGITFGAMVGAVSNKKESTKIGILMSSTMLWSFLSGMMMVDIKYIIAEKVPIIAAINPVNMITDGLYALYYYNTLDRYNYNIISLIVFSLTMITLIYFMIRRKSYDSI